MSSVVISGDTSGSVTLQAPAVAGTTVLTLPATSGTVVTTATSTGISGSAITTGTVGVSVGGTGANTLTANNVILGAGTSAVTFVAPGSTGNVLTSNGTTWTSAAAGGGQLQTQLFTAPGTWTKPAACTQVLVTVVGGGGGSGLGPNPALPGTTGGTSSFGALVSATGGQGNNNPATAGTPGTGTVTTGTAIRTAGIGATPIQAFGQISFGSLQGSNGSRDAGVATYSISSAYMAGSGGQNTPTYPNGTFAGNGGIAQSITPVSSPVAVTVGSGGATHPLNPGGGGVGGAVVVEFVG
jgi:hypothetical protein